MITAREAIDAAYIFINSLYDSEELIDLALEEIELSSDEQHWLVTLGFTRVLSKSLEEKVVAPWEPVADAMYRHEYAQREYKIIEVDAETSHADSMKIRKIIF